MYKAVRILELRSRLWESESFQQEHRPDRRSQKSEEVRMMS